MAIEDGGCLGVLLSNITSKSQIAERLRLFEDIRFERASVVQILSNASYEEVDRMKDEAAKFTKGALPSMALEKLVALYSADYFAGNQLEIHKYFFTYNVLEDSKKRIEELVQKSKE